MSYDVSVIVVSYNSTWISIKKTILSILRQKHVLFEMIYADDGSTVNYEDEVVKLCKDNQFCDYKTSILPDNQGTVSNIYNALKIAAGNYTKTIAPGDMLYNEETLHEWVKFMDDKEISISFGDAVYFQNCANNVKLLPSLGSPVNTELYDSKGNQSDAFVDYLVANDTLLGAAQLMKTSVLNTYINLIHQKVKFAEDYMVRIMAFDGVPLVHYPNSVIWYEYGDGISTSKDSKWEKALHDDFIESERIISTRTVNNNLQRRYLKVIQSTGFKRKVMKLILFPKVILFRFRMKHRKAKMMDICYN